MGSAVLIGLTAAGAVVQGIMQHNAAKAQAAAAEHQAKVAKAQAEAQARISEQNEGRAKAEAEAVSRDSAIEQRQMRNKIRAIQAQQAANYGASGLSLASGTPLTVMTDTAVQGEEDVRNAMLSDARRKFALINQAQDYNTQARYQRQAGQNQYDAYMGQARAYKSAGNNALAGSIFSAAVQTAANWGGISAKTPVAPVQHSYATLEDELTGKNPIATYRGSRLVRRRKW